MMREQEEQEIEASVTENVHKDKGFGLHEERKVDQMNKLYAPLA